MKREFFMQTERIGFSKWQEDDLPFAQKLWGNPQVTRYICAGGKFSIQDIKDRLNQEINNGRKYNIEYWPVFEISTNTLIGCCGLRPHKENEYEVGVHLLPEFWGKGYASEAVRAVIPYAFKVLDARKLFAGHNPENAASRKLLTRLGFEYIGEQFYTPTGLYHPSYELKSMCPSASSNHLKLFPFSGSLAKEKHDCPENPVADHSDSNSCHAHMKHNSENPG